MSRSVYLSPSTQENNKGCGTYGTEEKMCNKITDITEAILKQHNIIVYRNKPTMYLTQLVADSNNKHPDVHLAIHTNAGGGRGAEVYCYKFGGNGEKLAKNIYSLLAPLTPTSDRGIKQGFNFYGIGKHMYEVAYTSAPASLVEIAFHDNVNDAAWIANNTKKIGEVLAKGILNYFNISYKAFTMETKEEVFYRVVTGSFKNKENAEQRVKELKEKDYDSFIEKR